MLQHGQKESQHTLFPFRVDSWVKIVTDVSIIPYILNECKGGQWSILAYQEVHPVTLMHSSPRS